MFPLFDRIMVRDAASVAAVRALGETLDPMLVQDTVLSSGLPRIHLTAPNRERPVTISNSISLVFAAILVVAHRRCDLPSSHWWLEAFK